MSFLANLRKEYVPPLPTILKYLLDLEFKFEGDLAIDSEIRPLFPELAKKSAGSFVKGVLERRSLKVGVVLSGGQAAGGHNVIAGIYKAIKAMDPDSVLIGFLGGPKGILENRFKPLSDEVIHAYFNQGGFDMIGSGRDKIETPKHMESALKTCQEHDLDGLIIIGGDDSNTNGAFLAEYFLQKQIKTVVVGVPKTIDGDLKNEFIETSFGFDTAVKIYSESIGNILVDTLSAKKYWYFIKLMGRSASHIALACALQTRPNLTLIGEEKPSLEEIVDEIVTLIEKRASGNKNYGVILIPEGIIEFISGLKKEDLPQEDLELDPHGNIQVSKIETERFLMKLVQKKLSIKASMQPLFFGYEGRSGLPSNFDASYCYALGHVAALLVANKATGTMAICKNLNKPAEEWEIGGAPLISMLHLELRKGEMKPVIKKALVDLKGEEYQRFLKMRDSWKWDDEYLCPGPIQFWGPAANYRV